ncbi:MAG TPA: PTS sugar transporter subunit IIA [Candidatus Korarchaeota archaeon]|nr:PTS sugar transporter subunit IIA [Candidatus Korarchaeota archaeon]
MCCSGALLLPSDVRTLAILEVHPPVPTPVTTRIPTGVNVAIPHADLEHVIKQALVIGATKEPSHFII